MNPANRSKAPRYRRVPTLLWAESWFLDLSAPKPSGRVLYLALATGPTTSAIPGLYLGGVGTLSDQLGWSVAATTRTLRELEAAGAALIDWKARLVFLPRALDANPPENPNVGKAWATGLLDVQSSPLLDSVVCSVRQMLEAKGPEWIAAFDEIAGARKPSGKPFGKPSVNPSERVVEAGAGGRAGKEQEAEKQHPGAASRRGTTQPSGVDALARPLSTKLGASLPPCRKQVTALRLDGWSDERIAAAIEAHGEPGLAPWDWTKRATGNRAGASGKQTASQAVAALYALGDTPDKGSTAS